MKKKKILVVVLALVVVWLLAIAINVFAGASSFWTIINPLEVVAAFGFSLSWAMGVPAIISVIVAVVVMAAIFYGVYKLLMKVIK